MRYLTIVATCFVLAGCVTTKDRTEYDRHAPAIMAYVAEQTGKPPAPIPEPSFRSAGKWGAVYDAKTNTIILGPDWQPSTEGLGILAHEFTHAVQHHANPAIVNQHLEWMEQAERGKTSHLIDFSSSAVQTCIAWEREAYRVDIAYRAAIDPEAVRQEIKTLTHEEAAAVFARSSCKEMTDWRDKVHGIERGYGKTYQLRQR